METYRLTVNGQPKEVTVNSGTPLLWVLREELKMTGTKYGCGIAACGACTVHLAGVATRSCIVPVSVIGGRRIFKRSSATFAGGMLISLPLDLPLTAEEAAQTKPQTYPPDAFVHITPDGKIIIQVNRLEFGQGVHTSLPLILADELDADWS